MFVSGESALLLWVAVCVVIILGGFVHGALGMGFPLVTTPLLATMMDVRTAILVTLLPTAALNIVSLFQGGGWLEVISKYWPFALCALIGTWISTEVLILSDPEPFRLLLALIVLLYLWVSARQSTMFQWVSGKPLLSMVSFGLAGGLSAGATNVMVPIMIVYALEAKLATAVMIQVFNFCFLTGKATQLVIFGSKGLLSAELVWKTLPLALLALATLQLGLKIRERVNAAVYKQLIRYVLGLLAVMLLAQFTLNATATT